MDLMKYDPFDMRSFWRWPTTWDEDSFMTTVSDGLDVWETDNEIVVRANVAGVDADKVDITFEKGIVWIRGEQTEESQEGKKFYKKTNRSYSYKVAVPGNVDLKTDPQAAVKNGVVELHFRKAEEAKPRKIAVKSE
ncbi:MAG: hypothetical protein UY08_C0011G0008 [Candidatus Gottesmanbacteria bacterium GW2011_GWA1_47_8]|uniref:SHSP domain-containing protein n=1 Tax=Candidatus Gottesmanbacteria bacterium GW2011_GWA1_47_8 TaxID=1618438 RepID=A0A0G1TG55_9BACT|nr:MAG: hypothetical protein UY08_C0011G0008 [Candidatus Gottesmanbacteria bacterium GW2011_GWA1_47_8]